MNTCQKAATRTIPIEKPLKMETHGVYIVIRKTPFHAKLANINKNLDDYPPTKSQRVQRLEQVQINRTPER